MVWYSHEWSCSIYDIISGSFEAVGGVPEFWDEIKDNFSHEEIEDWKQSGIRYRCDLFIKVLVFEPDEKLSLTRPWVSEPRNGEYWVRHEGHQRSPLSINEVPATVSFLVGYCVNREVVLGPFLPQIRSRNSPQLPT